MASEAFVGGAFIPSAPLSVGGSGYPAPGAAANPPNVPGSRAMRARNDRGSNARIPYARIVPLQPREEPRTGPKGPKGPTEAHPRTVMVDGKAVLEYDGLREGELAWILGRRFLKLNPDEGKQGELPAGGADALNQLSTSQRFGHQAYAGQGIGVDRMQRLASTAWMESMMRTKMADAKIYLHELRLDSAYALKMDSGLKEFETFLQGSSALYAADVAYMLGQATRTTSGAALATAVPDVSNFGVCVLETGPFLRGAQVETAALKVPDFWSPMPSRTLDRNMPDSLAFSALMLEVRRRNLMDWTPDGIVVSKLESPAEDPHTSIAMDARSAQTFNVAVQGPAITATWTSDVQDTRLLCQPMDKVFVCLVADLSWTTDTAMNAKFDDVKSKRSDLTEAMKNVQEAIMNNVDTSGPRTALTTAIGRCKAAANTMIQAVPPDLSSYEKAVDELAKANARLQEGIRNKTALEPLLKDVADKEQDRAALLEINADYATVKSALGGAATEAAIVAQMRTLTEKNIEDILKKQQSIRTCENNHIVARATLSRFRLMRSTSSHMLNYSHLKALDSNSRCGLKLGKLEAGGEAGVGEYIVGAWCIGTVADSAASRANNGAPFKVTPTNMTINLNVNVDWWSGDQLYKQYMDKSGSVRMRGKPASSANSFAPTDKNVKMD